MARFKDPQIPAAAFKPYLESGETLQHWAYGVKQPSMAIVLPLIVLAVLPGLIAQAMLTKEYVVGLTDRRFIVLQFSGSDVKVKQIIEYPRGGVKAKTSTGSLFTHINVLDPAKPFVAKFHRMGMQGNREHAMAIAAAISGTSHGASAPVS